MNKTVKILLVILCVVCLGVFLFSGYKLFSKLSEYKAAQKSYEKMSEQYVTAETPAATTSPVSEADTSDEEKETSPITVDFTQLLATNEDVCGWLYSKDTVINYPVAQGEDNNEYLHHLLDGTYNSSGTLFLDCECGPEFSGANSIIYGHNMKNGSMFNSLHSYSDQAYYDAHPVMYLNTCLLYTSRFPPARMSTTTRDSSCRASSFRWQADNQEFKTVPEYRRISAQS